MTTRIACCVPFCRRTCRNDRGWAEWICGNHWRLVPKQYRRAYQRFLRHRRKPPRDTVLTASAGDRLWSRVKRAAFEAAGGIA